jgi:hypothetical protein
MGLQLIDARPMDHGNDLAGYSQPLLRSHDRVSQELRQSCLPQLWPPMRFQESPKTSINRIVGICHDVLDCSGGRNGVEIQGEVYEAVGPVAGLCRVDLWDA